MNGNSSVGNFLLAVFLGGLGCGVFDITQAFIAWSFRGVKPVDILHHVASGVLGPNAFRGGAKTAVVGMLLHFFIAFSAAAAYCIASRWIPFLLKRPVLAGLLYGEAVFLFMYFVVVPLSAAPKGRFTLATLITGPIGHTILVGLPISLAAYRFLPLR